MAKTTKSVSYTNFDRRLYFLAIPLKLENLLYWQCGNQQRIGGGQKKYGMNFLKAYQEQHMRKSEIMPDIVCDTNVLSDILIQFYNNYRSDKKFIESKFVSKVLSIKLNKAATSEGDTFLIIASSFAFVELARKFNSIFKDKISVDQFRAFIDQPPEWFLIQDVDSSLFNRLLEIPPSVTVNNRVVPIEWADALHVAAAIARDVFLFASSDSRLPNLAILKDHLI